MWSAAWGSASSPSTNAGRSAVTSSHSMSLGSFFVEHIAQLAAATMQPDLGGGDGDSELVGDRLVREVVDVLQHTDAPELGAQLVERGRDAFERLCRLRHRGGLQFFVIVGGLEIVGVGLGLLAAAPLDVGCRG